MEMPNKCKQRDIIVVPVEGLKTSLWIRHCKHGLFDAGYEYFYTNGPRDPIYDDWKEQEESKK